jgi:hypothetical protein
MGASRLLQAVRIRSASIRLAISSCRCALLAMPSAPTTVSSGSIGTTTAPAIAIARTPGRTSPVPSVWILQELTDARRSTPDPPVPCRLRWCGSRWGPRPTCRVSPDVRPVGATDVDRAVVGAEMLHDLSQRVVVADTQTRCRAIVKWFTVAFSLAWASPRRRLANIRARCTWHRW